MKTVKVGDRWKFGGVEERKASRAQTAHQSEDARF
jgi:hypothetical protein